MESFNSTDGWYEGRPVASGSTPQNRSSARSSPRQRHQSREPDYPRKSNLPGIQGKVCSARDPSPQQSASSDPSANRAAIIPRESHRPARFYTARVDSGGSTADQRMTAPGRDSVRYPVAMGWSADLEEAVRNKLDV